MLKKAFLRGTICAFLISLLLSPQQVLANGDKIKILEEKLDALSSELEELKTKSTSQFLENIHFHGYGELHYNNTDEPGKNDKMDFHRMVIGVMYHFNDRIVLDTEVDFEHAASEMELEYAHINFLLSPGFNIRIGSVLMPVGYLNEFHEPTKFYSVERPYVQKDIIPTTWQEGGAGIFGSMANLNYRGYIVGGLDASKFTPGSGIRNGRGKVANALSDDLAVVGRLEYDGLPGFRLGGSGYLGDASQNKSNLSDATVSIIEGDMRYRLHEFELTGLIASINVDDTDKIKSVTGNVVGKNILGWYVEGTYHFSKILPKEQDIVAFVRHEQYNTQESVKSGLSANLANDRRVTTIGLAYYPIPRVAVKGDVELWENGKGTEWEQFNLGIGFEY